MSRIAILQSQIPHYREEFFRKFSERNHADLFIYHSEFMSKKGGFKVGNVKTHHIKSIEPKGFLFYNPFPLLKGHDVIILPLHFAHLTTWLILLFKFILRKEIILWGHGISVKRYLKEESYPDWKLKLMISMADGIWTYMEKEAEQWKKIFPNKAVVALNNTISSAAEIVAYSEAHKGKNIDELKQKYGITQEYILLFCARFEGMIRRTDLLEQVIKRLDTTKYGFVIIGAGHDKPDFSIYNNVYDFGAVYDTTIKEELFCLADIYFQPGWVGLSIVEAMAYGLPIFTFRRSVETLQCVEYSYIVPEKNGCLFDTVDECVSCINSKDKKELESFGTKARNFVKHHATVDMMVQRAESIIK